MTNASEMKRLHNWIDYISRIFTTICIVNLARILEIAVLLSLLYLSSRNQHRAYVQLYPKIEIGRAKDMAFSGFSFLLFCCIWNTNTVQTTNQLTETKIYM